MRFGFQLKRCWDSYILSNLAILLDKGGWVWNISFVFVGFARKSGATAPETFIGVLCWIFFSAPISPVGVRMNLTADESAAYSRFREIASWTRATIIGARIARTIPIIMKIAFPLSLLPPPPLLIDDQNKLLRKICEMIAIIPTRTAVSVMNLMS